MRKILFEENKETQYKRGIWVNHKGHSSKKPPTSYVFDLHRKEFYGNLPLVRGRQTKPKMTF